MAGTTIFTVDDFHAAPDARKRQVRGAPSVGRLGLPDKLSCGGADVRRKLRWAANELNRRTIGSNNL